MCGIIGYVGFREAFPLLVEGLKKIEYRGYDSAGTAVLTNEGIKLIKDKGKIDEVFKGKKLRGSIGIAHTRWATHGKVTKENAHPHKDCEGRVVVVHNGVIENAEELRNMLKEKGHEIRSETDTELIAHLIEEKLKDKLPMIALREVMLELKGSFAIAVLIEGEERIFFGRKDSPLLIGIGNGEMFVASDVAAFLSYTKDYIPLENYDYGYITKDRYALFNALSGKKASREALRADFSREDVEKGEYEHFMLKEIDEQSHKLYDMFSSDVSEAAHLIRLANRLHLVGAGTSYHASLLLKYLLERNHGIESDAVISSEYSLTKQPDKRTLVVAFSQSGETADTLSAVRKAKENNSTIVAITNIRGSTIDRMADKSVYMNAGLEVGVAATKTFLAQLIISYRLAGDVKREEIEGLIKKGLEMKDSIKDIAMHLREKEHVFYLGRGLSYPMALEGALKLKEISYIHAEAYAAGELKHGPISLIDENAVAVVLAPKDETYKKTISNIEEVKARGAKVIVLTDGDVKGDWTINIPTPKRKELYPFAELVPLQLLAYYTAVHRGLDTDKPRNLAKSVTVE